MPVEHREQLETSLIVGCGYVGRVLARKLREKGVDIFGTVRSPDSAAKLVELGVRPLLMSVTDRLTVMTALKPALDANALDVYYLVPPGRPQPDSSGPTPRQVIIDGAKNVLTALPRDRVTRIIVASSTAVYGQSQGELVDADTPAEPSDERGRLLLDGERLWRNSGFDCHIVRLAGLYGPGRIVGLKAVRDGAPLVGDPSAWLNLLHVDDAAELLTAVMTSRDAAEIELGCDGTPVRRIDYYQHLAKRIGAPPVRVLDAEAAAVQFGVDADRLRRATNKRCDNVPTCRRTGWLPTYSSYEVGLDALVGSAAQQA